MLVIKSDWKSYNPTAHLFGLFAVIAFVAVGIALFAARSPEPASALTTVPTRMNFQGRLADSTGNIKPNGTYNMRLRLYTAASGGTAVWTEDRLVSAGTGITLTNGLFALQLGSVTSLPASLFASGPLYLEVELPTPATATTSSPSWLEGAMTPRNQMATSAYAYNSETLDGFDSSDFAAVTGGTGYVQNTTSPQAANFNVTGNGIIGGSLTVAGAAVLTATTGVQLQGASPGAQQTGNINISGTVIAGGFSGSGSGLTNLSASNLSSGTVASARLSGVYTGITGVGTLSSLGVTGNVTVGGTLNLTGGVTASRPSSPSEGTIYFDTTTKELLTYANGKWKTDGNTETIVVAASNSSQAAKDAADYVADGNGAGAEDGDQVQINAALTAGAGGKVYLMPGDYTVDASILIPDDTTLAGSGSYSQIESNFGATADSIIEESSLSSASGMTIQDVYLDGRKDINTFNSNAIHLDASKTTIKRVNVVNPRLYAIFLSGNENMITESTVVGSHVYNISIHGQNNIIKNNRTSGSMSGIAVSGTYAHVEGNISENNNGYGFGIDASRSSITGNKAINNSAAGMNLFMTDGNTVSGNTIKDNATWGIEIADDSYIDSAVITSNHIEGNPNGGIWAYNATNTVISNNRFKDNGGTSYNNALVLEGTSTKNTINGNSISDLSATTRDYAIVLYAGAVNNYISDNLMDDFGSISDLNGSGANTYASQVISAANGDITTSGNQLQMASATSLNMTTGTGNFSVSVNGTQRLELSSAATKLWFSGQYSQRLCHNTADSSAGRIATIGDCSAGGADFAEYYGSPGNVPTGTIVQYDASKPVQQVPDPTAPGRMGNKAFVRIANERSKALGVHSTNPYIDILGKEYYTEADNIIPVGLAGRVPVRVNTSGGAIAIGDPVTLSSTPGVGTKATTAGQIIGYSMENFSDAGEGTIVVLISTGYWAPEAADMLQGQYSNIIDLQVTGTADIAQLNVSGLATFKELKVIDSLSVQGALTVVGKVETGDILVNGLITSRGQTPTIEAGVAMGALGTNGVVSVDGTDTAGTVTFKATSEQVMAGVVAHIDFAGDFQGGYRTVLSATNDPAADLRVYIIKTAKGFDIISKDPLKAGIEYTFDYIIIGVLNSD